MPIRILLQTTIPYREDDWHIGRFGLLVAHLRGLKDEDGAPRFVVTARDRAPDASGDDPVLSGLAKADFDELWLFAVDTGNGLTAADQAGILQFRARGGGLMITRDHMDLGCSICELGPVGAAHIFRTHNAVDPLPLRTTERRRISAGRISTPVRTGTSSPCRQNCPCTRSCVTQNPKPER